MADVSSLSGTRSTENHQRGQILIITALVLAMTLVLLAVLLNSVIYAENAGSRGGEIGGHDAASLERAVGNAGETLIRYTNKGATTGDDHTALADDLNTSIESWHNQSQLQYVSGGTYTAVSVADTRNGSQIIQDEERSFESHENETTWTLATDVLVRNYTMTVTEEELENASDPFANVSSFSIDPFQLNVSDESGAEWRLYIYSDANDHIFLVAEDSNGDFTDIHHVEAPEATIDFASGMVDGEPADAVTFAPGLDSPYTLTYENGANGGGEYRLIVDEAGLMDESKYSADPSSSPYVLDAIYSAEINVTYETHQIKYRSAIRTAPGELHD